MKTILVSQDKKTLILEVNTAKGVLYVVQSIATIEPCAEPFEDLDSALCLYMEITLEDQFEGGL
jgi:hypothetical protein